MSSDRYVPPRHTAAPRFRTLLALGIGLLAGLLVGGTAALALVPAPPTYTDQCVRTPKANGGLVLDCDPIATPSDSPSASPSATLSPSPSPSTTPSPSPSVSPTSTTAPPTTPPASPSSNPTSSLPPTGSPTPSPTTPSPSPTGPMLNCAADPGRCGYPTPATTGVPAGTVLTPFTGDYYITTANKLVQNMEINGCIWVHAPGAIITNVRVKVADRCSYGISTYNANGTTILDKVEVVCNYAHGTGLAGPGFKASRVWLHACENGSEINANSSIVDSVVQGSEQGPGDPHGDGIQSQGGNNVVIRHNTLLQINPMTAAIITNPTQNNGWLIEDNFMGGGAYTLYGPEQGTGWTVRNNRFVRAKTGALYSAAYGLTDACNHAGIIWSGNYRDDDLSVVSSTA